MQTSCIRWAWARRRSGESGLVSGLTLRHTGVSAPCLAGWRPYIVPTMNAATPVSASPRAVVQTLRGMPASDGAGVKLTRVIGQPKLPDLDPFLMLDEFGTDKAEDYIAGFPDHPHRGFETVTYMLDGRMRHKDNHGNQGVLVPGAVQWMTAGRGIVHSEMPRAARGQHARLPAVDQSAGEGQDDGA